MSNQTTAPTQQYLNIAEIKEGVVILKGGGLRAVLMASSVNFVLKSEQEQGAIVYKFQQFLNSLDFPIQVVASSRKFYVGDYLKALEEKIETQENELLRIQTTEYVDFVRSFVDMTNIMSKTFYIVIPFSPIEVKRVGASEKFRAIFKPSGVVKLKKEKFEQYRNQLWQRVEHITMGLRGAGIRTVPLNTQELIELYYTLYNPGTAEKRGLTEVSQLDITQ